MLDTGLLYEAKPLPRLTHTPAPTAHAFESQAKVIQITTGATDDREHVLYALKDDGTIWRYSEWTRELVKIK